jgi:hypothetical protein
MKAILIIPIIFVFITKTYCQNTETPALSKAYYLQKSKTQKTIAWVLLGGGVGMMFTGALINGSQNLENVAGVFVGETSTDRIKDYGFVM